MVGSFAVASLILGKVPERTLGKAVADYAGAVMSQVRLIRRSSRAPMPRALKEWRR